MYISHLPAYLYVKFFFLFVGGVPKILKKDNDI